MYTRRAQRGLPEFWKYLLYRILDVAKKNDSWENESSKPLCFSATSKLQHSPESPVPEFIDPVFAKTSPKRSFLMTENERFGLVSEKSGSINTGTELLSQCHSRAVKSMTVQNCINRYSPVHGPAANAYILPTQSMMLPMVQISIKTPNPKCRLFLKIYQ